MNEDDSTKGSPTSDFSPSSSLFLTAYKETAWRGSGGRALVEHVDVRCG